MIWLACLPKVHFLSKVTRRYLISCSISIDFWFSDILLVICSVLWAKWILLVLEVLTFIRHFVKYSSSLSACRYIYSGGCSFCFNFFLMFQLLLFCGVIFLRIFSYWFAVAFHLRRFYVHVIKFILRLIYAERKQMFWNQYR